MLRKILGSKMHEVIRGLEDVAGEQLEDVCYSTD